MSTIYVEESRINWKSGIMVSMVRLVNDMSPIEFGEKFGVSPTELHLIEEGHIEPRENLIKSICRQTNLDFAQMCGDKPYTRAEALAI